MGSPILATEQHYYRFDALLSIGVMLAFGLSWLMHGTALQPWACYVDRITSYNVCYTKLLRDDADPLQVIQALHP